MQRPVQILSSNFSLTESAQTDIRHKAAKLDTYYDHILVTAYSTTTSSGSR